jgi:N-carbamoylputrescine amidase
MNASLLRVSAVQVDCQPGCVEENLRHALPLVEAAAARGAQLVLLPELMPSGYCLTEALWDAAEPFGGRTVGWLTTTARRLSIYLGTTFLEVDGEDFYNTFALATPEGGIAGRVRKSPPASLEAYFYRAGSDSHVLDTDLGRIGVGICYENLLNQRLCQLYAAGVDLVLQPTAAGRPKPIIQGDIVRFDRMVRRIAPGYARTLGVPAILADRCGPLHTALPAGFDPLDSAFPGLSCIADSTGRVVASLGEAEGVIVADVRLDPALKGKQPLRRHEEMWALPVPWYAFIWPMTQVPGEQAYEQSARRRERARRISQAAAVEAD